VPQVRMRELPECPKCRSEVFESVTDGETANFLCLACLDCWHVELGWIHRVDPRHCPGCEHLDLCLAVHPDHATVPTTLTPRQDACVVPSGPALGPLD
jgi:hypothetical protein